MFRNNIIAILVALQLVACTLFPHQNRDAGTGTVLSQTPAVMDADDADDDADDAADNVDAGEPETLVGIDANTPETRIKRILVSAESSAYTEGRDRMNRARRLSREMHLKSVPDVDLIEVDPRELKNVDYPIPVLRVRFSDMAFFNVDSDRFRKSSRPAIEMVAHMMEKDMPDTQLLLLGHTDSKGSAAYNMDLSRRRAVNVLRALHARGVKVSQMSTLAIGEMQPIATNRTKRGRASNRRVEFYFASRSEANVAAVRTAEYCRGCIDDIGQSSVSAEKAEEQIADLQVIKISENDELVETTEKLGKRQVLAHTLEEEKRPVVQLILKKRQVIHDY